MYGNALYAASLGEAMGRPWIYCSTKAPISTPKDGFYGSALQAARGEATRMSSSQSLPALYGKATHCKLLKSSMENLLDSTHKRLRYLHIPRKRRVRPGLLHSLFTLVFVLRPHIQITGAACVRPAPKVASMHPAGPYPVPTRS